MFRRIELIHESDDYYDLNSDKFYKNEKQWFKQGLMGISPSDVAESWITKLRGPDCTIPTNARFYFTEKGWDEIGRKVISACIKNKQQYRVIAVKENAVHVVWRDKYTGYEVAAQPLKKENNR